MYSITVQYTLYATLKIKSYKKVKLIFIEELISIKAIEILDCKKKLK